MFSLSTSFQPQQMVLPLINALHSLKNSATASVQSLHKDFTPENQFYTKEPNINLRDLGLTDINVSQLDELVSRLLPASPEPPAAASTWRTSHISSHSFFHNKHGFAHQKVGLFGQPLLHRQYHSPIRDFCSELHFLPVWIQSRGFKTFRTKARRLQAGYEGPAEPETYTPAFMKGFLQREKAPDAQSIDELVKHKVFPDNQQDAFKNGFAEGFMRSQSFTQRTQDSLRRTRLVLFVLLLIGLYGLSKTPFLSVRFRTTSGLDSALDPVELKNVTFEHVKGVEEAKNELQEVVEFLKNPQKFTVLGGKLPKGILLVGPPGTGKTLLARAVAGEADVPFYYASGSEFDEMFVGVGASRIRNLFKEAKANAPCVIFIDELDSVGGKRIESPMHPYSRQTINQLLAEMDGFKPNEGVIVIGATNFAEALDNALVRPGRFDMQVTVPIPDVKGRTEILNWYLSKIKVDSAAEAEIIARGTVGFSGADLENLVNQAALKAAVDGKEMVTMKDLEFAKDKILMGPERRSVEIDKKNKTITAYHESGHAIVAYYTKDAMPINKATIMPRGPTLGHVSLLPENDRWSETRAQLLAQMDVSMGGRVAEELIFGNEYITTGASSDFDGATKIAKMMVTRFGMSDKLGVMTYKEVSKQSPETQAAIEQEVRVLLKDSYERAKHILKTYKKEHQTLADALLQYETLDAKEIQKVLEGGFNEFDHKFFGISEAEANVMDPQQKLLLHCTYRALEDAGMSMERLSGSRTAVIIGLMNRDYETLKSDISSTINHYNATGTAMSITANRISFIFNLTGPSFAIDSACSSSLVALHLACQSLKQGDCEMAVCGGVSCIVEPRVFVALSKAKMISPEGISQPFSTKADGYGRGEGCGVVLLKPLKNAIRDCNKIWGVISKTAVNQDGRHVSPITKPSLLQQEELLRRIYSHKDMVKVQYIETHGTGTAIGDTTEAASISNVIAKAKPATKVLRLGSVKGNIGHTESAAGVAALIKAKKLP
uniref:ATP-dependent zinc metalloprotease YME1L1 n=1 Tax=Knipowitschia caucasica TaxID=637954 RepID=A0AAV2LAA3_KNICA